MSLLKLTVKHWRFSVSLFVLFSQRISSGPNIASRGTAENVLDRFLVRDMLDNLCRNWKAHALATLIRLPLQARIGLRECYFIGGARFGGKRDGQKQTLSDFCNSFNLKDKTKFPYSIQMLWMENFKGKFKSDLATLNYREMVYCPLLSKNDLFAFYL